MSVGFIGAGQLAFALAKGFTAAGRPCGQGGPMGEGVLVPSASCWVKVGVWVAGLARALGETATWDMGSQAGVAPLL